MGSPALRADRLSELSVVRDARLLRVAGLLLALVLLVSLFAAPALADAESVSLAPPTRVAGAGRLDGVACSSATSCLAVGQNTAGTAGVVVPITNGVPGTPTTVTGTAFLDGVAVLERHQLPGRRTQRLRRGGGGADHQRHPARG